MAEFKKINEVDILETMKDGLNVLIEDNGDIVRLPADSLVPADVVTSSELDAAIAAIPEPVTSWNDLTDKPFDKKRVEIILPETTFPAKMNSYQPFDTSVIERLRSDEGLLMIVDGIEYGIKKYQNSYFFPDIYSTPGNTPFYIDVDSGIMCRLETTLSIIKNISEGYPMDSSYLPSTVPVIPSAQVGQVIVVKAVDENNIPTEWETIDKNTLIDSSGGKWKLNVSTEGTLSATKIE